MSALMLSPDCVIRFKQGRAVIHNPRSPAAALETEDPAVVALVCRFAAPQEPQRILASMPANALAAAERLLSDLRQRGILIAPDNVRHPGDRFEDALQGLKALAEAVHVLGADVGVLGSDALRPVGMSGVGVAERIFGILAAVDALRAELKTVQKSVVSQQVAEITARHGTHSLKLNIGAGPYPLEGWVNIDAAPADLTINVNWGLPFGQGTVRLVHASHVLEHLHHPHESLPFLRECRRVLIPGGRLRVVVPDIEQCLRAYCAGDKAFFEARQHTWKDWPKGRTPLDDFLTYAGAGARPGDFLESHKYGFDFETLEKLLKAAGFGWVQRSTFMGSEEPELRIDESSAVAAARHGEENYSLFVEAVA